MTTVGTYKVHLPPHPTRMGGSRSVDNLIGVCLHTSEGGELPTSPEALSGFISSPRTATNLASYHAITDTDSIILEVPDNRIAYSAGGGNTLWLHICIPGKASQTREQWLDTTTRLFIARAAEYIVDKSRQYGFPLTRQSVEGVFNNQKGYCCHWDISRAFKKSTHTDVGVNFPWDILEDDINSLTKPVDPPVYVKGNNMISGLWKGPRDPAIFAVFSGGYKIWCYPGTVEEYQALCAINGASSVINLMDSKEMFYAMGPILPGTPKPGTVDEYGWA